jgi:exonuclease III
MQDLDKKKPVIWTGDLNVAATEMGMPMPNLQSAYMIFDLL